jgi:glucose 1-dehydrogenase
MRFKEKICLVTGGGSGIGRATCLQFAREGGTVIIVDRDKKAADETLQLIQDLNQEGLSLETDIGVPEQVKACVEESIRNYGRIDILVNNAAMMTFTTIVELEQDQWEQVMAVNLRSVFLFCKWCLPHMEHGSVVNISSVHAHQTTPNVVPYATSKGGIEAFTRGMSREYPPEKARFNSVAPGAVECNQRQRTNNRRDRQARRTGGSNLLPGLHGSILYQWEHTGC